MGLGSASFCLLLASAAALATLASVEAATCSSKTVCRCLPVGSEQPNEVDCSQEESRGDDALRAIPIDLPPSVTLLSLSHNAILSVDHFVSQYDRLTHLDLSNNAVSRIEPRSMKMLKKLAFLDLSNNKLSSLPEDAFSGLSSLTRLSLSGNRLMRLEARLFRDCPSLEHLDVSDNGLTFLAPELLLGVRALRSFVARNNDLTLVAINALKGVQLVIELDVSENRRLGVMQSVSNVVVSFDNFPQLRWLNVNGSQVERLSLSKQPFLRRLDASDNRLRSVASLGLGAQQSGLEELSLGMNPIDRLDAEGMASVPFLHVLVFGGCVQGLTVHQEAFSRNTQLRVLHLYHCPQLSALPARLLADLKQLRTLDLHDNALTAIPSDLADWHEVHYVDLSENKLDCNCEALQWMAELIREKGANTTVECASPAKLRGKAVAAAGAKCEGSGNAVVIGAVVAVVVLLVAVTVAVFMVMQRRRAPGSRRHRFKRGTINKADITMIPTETFVTAAKWPEDDDEAKAGDNRIYEGRIYEGHIYEELPLRAEAKVSEI